MKSTESLPKLPCSPATKKKYEAIKREAGLPFTVAVDKAVDLLAEKLGVTLPQDGAQPASSLAS